MKTGTVYLLPGRGEGRDGTVGRIIGGLGFAVYGRALSPEFQALRFGEQNSLVQSDLQTGFRATDSVLIGHSYGPCLLLHALADMPALPGRILFISPVLGLGLAAGGHYGSLPPRAGKLLDLARQARFPFPGCLEIHTGADDNGCDPKPAQEFAAAIAAAKLHVVPTAGHTLQEAYLLAALQAFLRPEKAS